MAFRNDPHQYGLGSKLLHWLIAVLMIAMLALGAWMVNLSYYDPWYHDALKLHKSLGISLGSVVLIELIWLLISTNPAPQTSLTSFKVFASRRVHHLLLFAMVVLPVTGYLISSSEAAAIEVFHLFSLPALWQISDDLLDLSIALHYYLAYLILALVVLHATAALKHQYIDHKGTLKRML